MINYETTSVVMWDGMDMTSGDLGGFPSVRKTVVRDTMVVKILLPSAGVEFETMFLAIRTFAKAVTLPTALH